MIIYITQPKISSSKLLQPNKKEKEKNFNNAAEYKINSQKSVILTYIMNKQTEKNKENNLLHNSLKKIKYLRVTKTNRVKHWYDKKVKTLQMEGSPIFMLLDPQD